METTLFSKYSNSKSSLFSGKNKYINCKNSITRKIFPFNLKSKQFMKYEYFGYVKQIGRSQQIHINNNHIKYIKNGYGKIIYDDKSIFKSNFIDNKAFGISHYINEMNNEEFIGEYYNNILNGFGIYISKRTNQKYIGYFKNESLNGVVIEESFEHGYTYYGEYINNNKHGYGLINWKEGTIYEGRFYRNQMSGYAIIKYPDKKIYKGQVKRAKLFGFGQFIWPEGKRYIGHYKNNKKNGFGIFLWDIPKNINNNNIGTNEMKAFIGFWCEGIINGVGIKIIRGKMKSGLWINGTIIMWFEKNELIKRYIKNNQTNYLKILLMNQEDLLNILKKCYLCKDEK
jgi:hypothetical protein